MIELTVTSLKKNKLMVKYSLMYIMPDFVLTLLHLSAGFFILLL